MNARRCVCAARGRACLRASGLSLVACVIFPSCHPRSGERACARAHSQAGEDGWVQMCASMAESASFGVFA
eukprot:3783719-Pleurochrysis_carterae.AAC.2